MRSLTKYMYEKKVAMIKAVYQNAIRSQFGNGKKLSVGKMERNGNKSNTQTSQIHSSVFLFFEKGLFLLNKHETAFPNQLFQMSIFSPVRLIPARRTSSRSSIIHYLKGQFWRVRGLLIISNPFFVASFFVSFNARKVF